MTTTGFAVTISRVKNVMKEALNLKGLELGMLLPGITVNTGPVDYFQVLGNAWNPRHADAARTHHSRPHRS
jgi:hypothetical protein